MAAHAYITAPDLLAKHSIRELADVAADHDVQPSSIRADLETEIGGGSSGNSDAVAALAVIQDAIDTANSTLDGYLQGRYSLPLSVVPDLLKLQAIRIARYELHDVDVPEEVLRRYTEALRYLEKIAAGSIKLADDTGAADGDSGSRVSVTASAATFTGRSAAKGGNDNDVDYLGCL